MHQCVGFPLHAYGSDRYIKPYGEKTDNEKMHESLGSHEEDPLFMSSGEEKKNVERITPALGIAWGLGFPDGLASMAERTPCPQQWHCSVRSIRVPLFSTREVFFLTNLGTIFEFPRSL
jgi:hypothetical protein